MKQLGLIILLAACGGTSTESTTPSQSTAEDNEAARSQLDRANELYEVMAQLRIDCGSQASLEAFTSCLGDEVGSLAASAQEVADAYRLVMDHSHQQAEWVVASLSGHGRTYALMIETMSNLEVPEIYPQAVLEQDVRMSDEARALIHEQVVNAVRGVVETHSAPILCISVVRDLMALRVANSQQVDSTYSQESAGRLSQLSDEEIVACVEAAQAHDETLQPYTPGEFQR